MRHATPRDPIAHLATLVDDAERAPPHERAAAIIRARHELDGITAGLAEADDVLARLATPAVALMRPSVELRRRAAQALAQRLAALSA